MPVKAQMHMHTLMNTLVQMHIHAYTHIVDTRVDWAQVWRGRGGTGGSLGLLVPSEGHGVFPLQAPTPGSPPLDTMHSPKNLALPSSPAMSLVRPSSPPLAHALQDWDWVLFSPVSLHRLLL